MSQQVRTSQNSSFVDLLSAVEVQPGLVWLDLVSCENTDGTIWASSGTSFHFLRVQLLESTCPLISLTTACTNSFASGCPSACWRYMISPIISAWNTIGFLIRSCSSRWASWKRSSPWWICVLHGAGLVQLTQPFFVTLCEPFHVGLYQQWQECQPVWLPQLVIGEKVRCSLWHENPRQRHCSSCPKWHRIPVERT